MRDFGNIIYIFGVILTFIGFITYNYSISNDSDLLLAELMIGVGFAALLTSYI